MRRSECAPEDVDDANQGGRVPFDGNCTVNLVVPEAGTGNVEAAVCLLHDDAVSDELEVTVDCGDGLEDLDRAEGTSSQIWLVQTCASLTL
jgi:hypothetical protein